MDKKNVGILAVVVVVVGVGAFFGGVQYGKTKSFTEGGRQQFGSGNFMTRGGGMGAGGPGGMARRTGMTGGMASFISGEVLSKDDKSITLKLMDGGSKTVYLGSSTVVGKTTTGSLDDVTNGVSVMVVGSASTDGSLTAQTIQIRPAGVEGMPGMPMMMGR